MPNNLLKKIDWNLGKDLPMLPWSRHQENLSSSFIVGQQLGNVSPGGLEMSVH